MGFLKDLVGAVFDVLKLIGYFIAGGILVGAPLYLIESIS